MSSNTRINFYVDEKQLNFLRKLAKSRGKSYSALIRAAIAQYIKQEIRRIRADAGND